MGAGGKYHAASREELNLCIVQGTVDANGAIRAGSGFTVDVITDALDSDFKCLITFNAPFCFNAGHYRDGRKSNTGSFSGDHR